MKLKSKKLKKLKREKLLLNLSLLGSILSVAAELYMSYHTRSPGYPYGRYFRYL